MKRLLILLALAGVGTAMACGGDSGSSSADDDDDDDDGDDDSAGNKKDAGSKKDAGKSSSAKGDDEVVSRGLQIENLGDPCESVDDCKGDGTLECVTDVFGTAFPDGYCTANCMTDDECGDNGGCPLGPLASNPIAASFLSGAASCLQKCDASDPDSCGRDGYECASVSDLLGGLGGIAASFLGTSGSQTYCMPHFEIVLPEAGLPLPPSGNTGGSDAGSSSHADAGVVGGLDAGHSDAGRADAGRDAGR